MRISHIFVIAVCILLLASCKKTTNTVTKTIVDTVAPVTYPDYMVLKPGNYWIYETYRIENGVEQAESNYDSCYVEKDTLINNNTYHILVKNLPSYAGIPRILYLRDSLGYVVTSGGSIFFSSQDFTTIFSTIMYTNPPAGIMDTIPVTTQMGSKDSSVTVPIGVFPTNTFKQIYHTSPPLVPDEYDYRYAENIGLVSETVGVYATLPLIYEDRLVRYHLQ